MPAIDYENLRKFVAPEFVFGDGARGLTAHYVKNLEIHRPLLVTDEGLLASGWPQQVIAGLEGEDIAPVVFSNVTANPKDTEVMSGAAFFAHAECDAIVAVGGGSVIDCAKGIGIVISNGGHIRDYEGIDQVPAPCPPLICVPTTAGSAADVSQFAIITDSERLNKMALVSKVLVPDVSLVDPETSFTMNRKLTAATGLDAFTHAVEALVSNAGSPITDLHALEAVRLVYAHLAGACEEPSNPVRRTGMMRASLLAGLAFSNASLGAVHAMAHSLGGLRDAAHGECNAILLPHVMAYNFDFAREPYFRLALAMGLSPDGPEDANLKDGLQKAVEDLMRSVGFSENLSNLGIDSADIPMLADKAMEDLCIVTNPRPPSRKDLETLYGQAL